jgi:hypothetical protein
MKKILLSLSVFASLSLSAQTTIYSASTDADFNQMQLIDSDADEFNWDVFDWGTTTVTWNAQGFGLTSASYDNGTNSALTPDNWAITPAIDFTGFTGASLSFGRISVDADWPSEKYSVYAVSAASPSEAVTALTTSTALYTETIATGGVWETKTVDLSSFDGQANIYLAFRHHESTDNFLLVIDDIVVSGTSSANPTVTISSTNIPANGGTVSGTGEFNQNASVTLTAVPSPGFTFVNWTILGNVVSTDNPFTFPALMTSQVDANFSENAASTIDLSTASYKVFPNPAVDVLNIEFYEEISIVEVSTLDGKVLKSLEVNANKTSVDVMNFEAGVYTYKVITKKGDVFVNTFVKK